MRIFKTSWFSRFADKEHLIDGILKKAVTQLEAGQFDADLGGGVYKQRLARAGQGKSGGIVFLSVSARVRAVFLCMDFQNPVGIISAPVRRMILKRWQKYCSL